VRGGHFVLLSAGIVERERPAASMGRGGRITLYQLKQAVIGVSLAYRRPVFAGYRQNEAVLNEPDKAVARAILAGSLFVRGSMSNQRRDRRAQLAGINRLGQVNLVSGKQCPAAILRSRKCG
jgi:hypothetical protein